MSRLNSFISKHEWNFVCETSLLDNELQGRFICFVRGILNEGIIHQHWELLSFKGFDEAFLYFRKAFTEKPHLMFVNEP